MRFRSFGRCCGFGKSVVTLNRLSRNATTLTQARASKVSVGAALASLRPSLAEVKEVEGRNSSNRAKSVAAGASRQFFDLLLYRSTFYLLSAPWAVIGLSRWDARDWAYSLLFNPQPQARKPLNKI